MSRQGPIPRSVLLYSGGLDSVCFNHLLKPDILLRVVMGTNYDPRESQAVRELIDTGSIDRPKLRILREVIDLSLWARDDFIVPNRNAHLVLLASNYGDTIYLSSVYGDRSLDKDDEFFSLMERLLDHTWAAQHWTEARRFTVTSPFRSLTKTELVNSYLAGGGDPYALLLSYSCFAGNEQPCGVCGPCTRKWIALENNRVPLPEGYFAGKFWETEKFRACFPEISNRSYRGPKDDENTIEFLRRRRVAPFG